MPNIHNVVKNIKRDMALRVHERRFRTDMATIAIIALVGFAGFGLGILSERSKHHFPVHIVTKDNVVVQSQAAVLEGKMLADKGSVLPEGGKYVASKSGSKYHFPWCAGARSISEANKIWFDSAEEAKAAGYSPAGNCKGLE